MAKHVFLSPSWFEEVLRLHDAHPDALSMGVDIRMNLTITATPDGADLAVHVASTAGSTEWGSGHLESADVTLTLPFGIAREIFVAGNPQAGMDAFMTGRIIVQGDLTKLLAMQSAGPGPGAPALAAAMLEITE